MPKNSRSQMSPFSCLAPLPTASLNPRLPPPPLNVLQTGQAPSLHTLLSPPQQWEHLGAASQAKAGQVKVTQASLAQQSCHKFPHFGAHRALQRRIGLLARFAQPSSSLPAQKNQNPDKALCAGSYSPAPFKMKLC